MAAAELGVGRRFLVDHYGQQAATINRSGGAVAKSDEALKALQQIAEAFPGQVEPSGLSLEAILKLTGFKTLGAMVARFQTLAGISKPG